MVNVMEEEEIEKVRRHLQATQDVWDKYRNDLLALERKLGLSPSGPKTSIADMERVIGAFLILRAIGEDQPKRRGRPPGALNRSLAKTGDKRALYKRRDRARKKFESDYDEAAKLKAQAQELLRTCPIHRLRPRDK